MGQRKPNEPASKISATRKSWRCAGLYPGYFRVDDAGVDEAIKALRVLTQ